MNKNIRRFAPWSISKGQVANNCTFRFDLQYIKRIKQREIERPEGRIGSAAHFFLERHLKGDDYREAYQKAVMQTKLTRNETLELATFKDAVLTFTKRINAWRKKMDVKDEDFFIEKEVNFSVDLKETDRWSKDTFFRGFWDIGALVRKKDGLYVIVIDHKTGAPQDDLGPYRDQLWAYMASAKVLYPDLKGAQTAIHWMRADKPKDAIVWGKLYSSDQIDKEIMPWFWKYFEDATEKGASTPVPKQGWHCDFCGYKHLCPLYQR